MTQLRFFFVAVGLLLFWGCAKSSGAATSDALLSGLTPLACKAREAVANHPSLAAFEIEFSIRQAIGKARFFLMQPSDTSAAMEALAVLKTTLGPLEGIPSVELHNLLETIAAIDGRAADRQYHLAFAVALMYCLSQSGDGNDPGSAIKVVMLAEEYAWLKQGGLTRQSRITKELDGRRYDLWKVKNKDGNEATLYFDVQLMADSFKRVLGARSNKALPASELDPPPLPKKAEIPPDPLLRSCPIRAGDSLAKVKEVFRITDEPVSESPTPAGTYFSYHLDRYGIWIFFGSDKKVKTLRFDAPFAGKVGGVAIGDTKEVVSKLKGEPVKRFDAAWVYKSPEWPFLRYDFGAESERVKTIFSDIGTTD